MRMPIKEYQCNNEQCPLRVHRFEKFHRTHDEADREKDITVCEDCGCFAELVFSVTGTPQFKGSGFYKTDYV